MSGLDDIEDIIPREKSDEHPADELMIVPRARSRKADNVPINARLKGKNQADRITELEQLDVQSFVPGTHKVSHQPVKIFSAVIITVYLDLR